jgi:hypothetical protein
MKVSGQLHVSFCFTPCQVAHWIRGWMGPGPAADVMRRKLSCPYWESNSSQPLSLVAMATVIRGLPHSMKSDENEGSCLCYRTKDWLDPGRFWTQNFKQVRILDSQFKAGPFHDDVTLRFYDLRSCDEFLKIRGWKGCGSTEGEVVVVVVVVVVEEEEYK